MFLKSKQKETSFSHIAMFVNASETPFLSLVILCFYVFKIFTAKGLIYKKSPKCRTFGLVLFQVIFD